MSGRFIDSWPYVWSDIWEPIESSNLWLQFEENSGYSINDLYKDLYLELVKAFKKAPQPEEYDANATDPVFAREALMNTHQLHLRSEGAVVKFFENAYDVVCESDSIELEELYYQVMMEFISGRNLGYDLKRPFSIQPNLHGAFSAIFADISHAAEVDSRTVDALSDFKMAFQSVQMTKSDSNMKTFILKAAMLAEALASIVPNSRGQTLGDLCNSIDCWPHTTIREAVKKLYGFCSDYPGIRHNTSSNGQLRLLNIRDAAIIPMLLVVVSGYFSSGEHLQMLFKEFSDPIPQEPADPFTAFEPPFSADE